MNNAPERSDCLYAIRLLPADIVGASLRIAGRVEHVRSGRCHDFADGAALLARLALEQRQEQRAASAPSPSQ